MSEIITLNSTDKLEPDSREIINTNFANLNNDKLEKSANLSDIADPAEAANNILPSQTGQAGKLLSTDGAGNLSWADPTTVPDASTTTRGITKLSVDPANPSNPIAVGTNDPRMPTQDQADALAGTGIPSASNKYVTNDTLTSGLAGKVSTTGNETIAGVKTFSSIPVLPSSNPTSDNQAARKAYVDGKTGANGYAIGAATLFEHPFTNTEDNTYDEVITVGFQPRIIKLYFWAEGYCGGRGSSGFKGIAWWTGTTLSRIFQVWGFNNTYTPCSGADAYLGEGSVYKSVDDTSQSAIIVGDFGSNNGGKLTVSIVNITSTGFTIRKRTQTQNYGAGVARFAASYEVYQ